MTTIIEHCEYFKKEQCLSCRLLNHSYEDAVAVKLKTLQEKFPLINNPVINQKGFQTRNKAKFVVSNTAENPILGIPDSAFEIVDCPLHETEINILAKKIKTLITLMNIAPYNIEQRKGELKYLIILKAPGTNELMIRFVLRSKESLDRIKKNLMKIQELNHNIKIISVNIQSEHKAIIEGEEEIILTDEKYLLADINNFKLTLTTQSFFQTNSFIMSELYRVAAEWIKDLNISNALDLYCGVGGFSFSLAPMVEKILGIEISASAIAAANKNLTMANIKNITFKSLDVKDSLDFLDDKIDLLVVNPPRRGIDKNLITQILKTLPNYILYSSCEPITLEENLGHLLGNYTIEKNQAFDMFAYSHHWEVLILLERK